MAQEGASIMMDLKGHLDTHRIKELRPMEKRFLACSWVVGSQGQSSCSLLLEKNWWGMSSSRGNWKEQLFCICVRKDDDNNMMTKFLSQ